MQFAVDIVDASEIQLVSNHVTELLSVRKAVESASTRIKRCAIDVCDDTCRLMNKELESVHVVSPDVFVDSMRSFYSKLSTRQAFSSVFLKAI